MWVSAFARFHSTDDWKEEEEEGSSVIAGTHADMIFHGTLAQQDQRACVFIPRVWKVELARAVVPGNGIRRRRLALAERPRYDAVAIEA